MNGSVEELWQFVRDIAVRHSDNSVDSDTMMTSQDKQSVCQALYRAVQSGDVDLVDEMLLLLPGADINMTWYSENLLMAAIRAGQTDVAVFLMDNGINHHYSTTIIDTMTSPGHVSGYSVTCRQMAYDRDMSPVVDVIDELNGDSWPTASGRHQAERGRVRRLRRAVSQLSTTAPPSDSDQNCTAGKQTNEGGAMTSAEVQADAKRVSAEKSLTSRALPVEQMEENRSDNNVDVITLLSSRRPISCDFRQHHVVIAPPTLTSHPARQAEPRRISSSARCSRTLSADWSERSHVSGQRLNGLKNSGRKSAQGVLRSHSNNFIITSTLRPVSVRVVSQHRASKMSDRKWKGSDDNRATGETGSGIDGPGGAPWRRPVRVISPWKEDDPETVRLFETRINRLSNADRCGRVSRDLSQATRFRPSRHTIATSMTVR